MSYRREFELLSSVERKRLQTRKKNFVNQIVNKKRRKEAAEYEQPEDDNNQQNQQNPTSSAHPKHTTVSFFFA